MGEIEERLRTTSVGWEVKVGMRTLVVEIYVPVKHICNGCSFSQGVGKCERMPFLMLLYGP